MGVETRRLAPDDHALLAAAIRLLVSADSHAAGGATSAHLKAALDDPRCYFIASVEGSKPVGYLSAYRFPAVESDGFCVYLYDLVVDEAHRRKGIAGALIDRLKTLCSESGVEHIWVGTSLDNHAAQRTLEATGANKVSETYVEYVYRLVDGA